MEFKDNTMIIKEKIADSISSFLHEVGGEVQSEARRTVRVDTGKTKGSYQYKIRENVIAGTSELHVGSDYENAIWEEFGTGEHALNHDGRKGGWVYMDAKGDWHYTTGKAPTRPIYKAFTKITPKIKIQLTKAIKRGAS